jgi:hypothetical protein
MGISQFYSGAEHMGAHGMNGLVKVQLVVDISQFCSGVVQMGVLGMNQLVQVQLKREIY